MKFYEIEFFSIPKILFALEAEIENYKNSFVNRENYLEISLIKSGRICMKHADGSEQIIHPGFVVPILQDTNCRTYGVDHEKQKHSTVAVSARYSARLHDNISKDDIIILQEKMHNNAAIVLIPFQENLAESFPYFINAIKKTIHCKSLSLLGEEICVVSAFFELCGKFSSFVLNKINNSDFEISPMGQNYVDRIKQYIYKNYKEKIYIGDIAAKLNVSEGYLQSIFKLGTGMTIIEFYNKYRVNSAVQYIDNYGFSLKKAAESIGVNDEYYMSKLFKKVMGISYKEYVKYNSK